MNFSFSYIDEYMKYDDLYLKLSHVLWGQVCKHYGVINLTWMLCVVACAADARKSRFAIALFLAQIMLLAFENSNAVCPLMAPLLQAFPSNQPLP